MQRFSYLILLGLLAAALASPLLLQRDCTKGPEVWCQNLQTASHCSAVKHCRQTVWNKPAVKSIPCDLCKEVVTVVGKVLKDNATEEEINAYITKVCEFLPDPDLVSQCKDIVDAYLPNILDIIKEELDNPEVVCSALTLCQSLQKHLATIKLQKQLQSNKIPELDFSEVASPFMANVPLLLYPQDKPKQESQGSGNVCQDCVQLVTDLQEAVRTNSTFVSSLIEHAKEECERVEPAFADLCKSYISQYSDLAIQMLMHMQPQDICSMVGFCSTLKSVPLQTLVPAKVISTVKVEPIENSLSQTESFSLCDACTIMVEEVASLLESNKTEEEMVYGMEKVCSVLPEKYREECRNFVDVYGKSIIDMLLEATDPKMVCEMLKCCSKNVLPTEKIAPVQSHVGNICDVCKIIVAYADKELEKNATTAEIEEFLERVCRFLPESVSDQCVQFVEQYEPMVVQLLAEVMDPTFVCNKLGVCVASTQPLLGSEVCVRGPGYWCKNMETASQCNAIEHCKRHVWN
ncbi:prosaposin-like isoform X2 [Rhineura floridana]|uniref:prosaposin-like isoform X2 n=1 Tax=Rhineura floridana TaxID=261503 RepID=UPI002AC7FC3A|nr:prosaposin-like isoform X2 [Rhineura floridana]